MNNLHVAISKYAICDYVINPSPKLLKSIAIPSNLTVTAFHDDVYATVSNNDTYAINLAEDVKISLNSKAINCLSYIEETTKDKIALVILENGTIQKFKNNIISTQQNIPIKHIKQVEFIENRFVLIITDKQTSLYDLNNLTELRVSTSLTSGDAYDIRHFKDKIYRYNKQSQFFQIYQLTTLNEIHSIKIPFIKDDRSELTTFTVVNEFRIVLAIDNHLYLLDLFLGSVVTDKIFTHLKWSKLINAAKDGSYILSISCNNSNSVSIDLINLDLGSNNLKDSLGRGFNNYIKDKPIEKKPLLLKSLLTKEPEHCFKFDKILNHLTVNVNDCNKFDEVFYQNLKITNDYYTENDRFIVDQDFLMQVIDLILNNYKFDGIEPHPKTLTYLLTHPFYPVSKTIGILNRFKEEPRLYKQVIVTCPNLPLNELLTELFSIKNTELLMDISLRILKDYTKESIKQELKKLPKLEIHNFIKFIVEFNQENDIDSLITPQLFQLISLVIDSIGLFALDTEHLKKLSEYINTMIKIAQDNTELWYMIDFKSSDESKQINRNNRLNTQDKDKIVPPYSVEYLDI